MDPKKSQPPQWAHRLLEKFCPSHLLEEVEGDLLEEYQYQLKKEGVKKANRDYVQNVIGFLSPFPRKRKLHQPSLSSFPLISTIMWKNYVVTAMRNIARNKIYSIINLLGLTLGLVCSILIYQYVIYERSADEFHDKFPDIYRVVFRTSSAGGTPELNAQMYLNAGHAFRDEIASVANVARLRADFFQECPTISVIANGERYAFKDIRAIIVDSTFLDVFSFPLVKGNRSTALLGHSVIITERLAKRLFGNEDPVGKEIEYKYISLGIPTPPAFLVTGVVKDPPINSHIQFDIITPLPTFLSNIPKKNLDEYSSWGVNEFTTYVVLHEGTKASDVEKSMTDIVERQSGEMLKRINTSIAVQLQPLKSVYFDRETNLGSVGFGSVVDVIRTGNERMVYFLTIIAIITLAIALMSYVNLSTVRSLDRAKEVGIRKVIGAYKRNLRMQFFFEASMMNLAGLILAVLLVMLLVPSFNSFVHTNFTLASWFNAKFLMLIGGIFVIGVLLSGLYPAFILSSFKPIAVLKGGPGSVGSKSSIRKFLVVLQYAPAISLLICTSVVYTQLTYMRTMDLGLEMNQLITVRSPRIIPDSVRSFVAEAAFKKEVVKIPGIEYASYAGNQAGRGLNFMMPFTIDSVGDGGIEVFKCSGVDHDFVRAFDIKILAGDPFFEGMTNTYGTPNDFIRRVMVNETSIRVWGFKKPKDAVGRVLVANGGPRFYVQAVMEDFNWSSAHKAIDPVMLWYTPNNRFMTIRMRSGANFSETLGQVKTIYDQMFPRDVFHYEFADDVYNRQYGEDEQFTKLFGIFSGLAALIASMGLFGLAAFSAERRSREVGIRKVMGATVNGIVGLLGKEFVLLVFVAFVIASPIAWLVMSEWLATFAFHMPLNATPFVVAGASAVIIAIITVSWRTISVARANPIEALKEQ